MGDYILRAMSTDGFVKLTAIRSTDIVERARNIHKTLPTATAALGRVLTAASMMGNMQKIEDGSLTLQVKGDGPLGTILAVSDWEGNVRGYVAHPQVSLMEKYKGKLDVGGAVGEGRLTVIRDLQMKEPYIGSTELVSGEIAEDVTNYFVVSEQIPTACALGVLVDVDQSVKAAGGYLLQLLPGAPEETIVALEEGIAKAGNVTAMLDKGLSCKEMLQAVCGEMELTWLEETPVEYRCYCDRDRVTATLISLGRKELQEIIDEGESISIECQFCDAPYVFAPAEIAQILETL